MENRGEREKRERKRERGEGGGGEYGKCSIHMNIIVPEINRN